MVVNSKPKAFIFDMDGVLWRDNKPIPGSAAATQKLAEMDIKLFYLTNNSSHSRAKLHNRLKKYGFAIKSIKQIVTSASLVAYNLKKDGVKGVVLVFGSEALYDEISNLPDIEPVSMLGGTRAQGDIHHVPAGNITAIALGFDMRTSYSRMATVVAAANEQKCKIYCSNADTLCPHSQYVLPGTGNMLQPITGSLRGQIPVKFCGKPEKSILKVIRGLDEIEPENIIMVGDNLDTDVAFGKKCGMQTLLVESGVHSNKDVAERNYAPDYIRPDLASFVETI